MGSDVAVRFSFNDKSVMEIDSERLKVMYQRPGGNVVRFREFVREVQKEFGWVIDQLRKKRVTRVAVFSRDRWTPWFWVMVVVFLVLAGASRALLDEIDVPSQYLRVFLILSEDFQKSYLFRSFTDKGLLFGIAHYPFELDMSAVGCLIASADLMGLMDYIEDVFNWSLRSGQFLNVVQLPDCVILKKVWNKGGVLFRSTDLDVQSLTVIPRLRVMVDVPHLMLTKFEEYKEWYSIITESPDYYYKFRKRTESKEDTENILLHVVYQYWYFKRTGKDIRSIGPVEWYGIVYPHEFYGEVEDTEELLAILQILKKEEIKAAERVLSRKRYFVAEDLWYALWLDIVGIRDWGPALFVAIKKDDKNKYRVLRIPALIAYGGKIPVDKVKAAISDKNRRVKGRFYLVLDYVVVVGDKTFSIPVYLDKLDLLKLHRRLKEQGVLLQAKMGAVFKKAR